MDLFRRSRFLAAAVTSALLLSVVAFAATDSAAARRADPDAEFRATLTEFYADFDRVYAPIVASGHGSAGLIDVVAQARRDLASMPAQELAAMRDLFPRAFWKSWKTRVIPALDGGWAAFKPIAPSVSRMSHSCPQLYLGVQQTLATSLEFAEALLIAKGVELAAQIAYDIGSGEGTGAAAAVLGGVLGTASGARFALEEIGARADACEEENHKKILHDDVGPGVKEMKKSLDAVKDSLKALDNLDVKVSSRASQTSLDTRAAGIETVTNARASQIEALLKARADIIDAELKRRADNIDAELTRRADNIDAYQANVVDHQKLDLQVIEIERGRLLLIASEAGKTVNVKMTSMQVAEVKPQGAVAFQDVTGATRFTSVGAGVFEVALDMRGPAKDATVYMISVAESTPRVVPPFGDVTHRGTTIIRRSGT